MRAEVQQLMDYLADQGFRPRPREGDPDDLVLKSEGMSVIVSTQSDDPRFLRLIVPNFWSIESDLERRQVMLAADIANRRCKGVKIFTVEDDTWAVYEAFYESYTQFQPVFERSLSALHNGVRTFRGEMHELRTKADEEV